MYARPSPAAPSATVCQRGSIEVFPVSPTVWMPSATSRGSDSCPPWRWRDGSSSCNSRVACYHHGHYKLRSMDEEILKDACVKLEAALTHEKHRDIDGEVLWRELIFIKDLLEKSMGPLDIRKCLEKRPFYPFANIAYRILLTIPVTVASVERSFSKLKLLKSYMRSTMTQERLSGLATIALENDILEKINYKDMIEDFISTNIRRMMLFW
nr:uncharacterized protein LOC127335384 [Lolium perenne]